MAAVQKHPISRLQEICQQWKLPLPTYREAQGSYQEFGCECSLELDGEALTFYGRGRTKKLGKASAAQSALSHVEQNKPELLEPPPLQEVDESVMAGGGVWPKAVRPNQQHSLPVDAGELARETERLDHTHVGMGIGMLIQQGRMRLGLSQKDLAASISERQSVVVEYESGRALPSQQIIAKMERALGMHLSGERAGELKQMGRGRGRGRPA